MNTKQAELLQRLEKFSPDSADASFPFSSRLAKENQWSLAYSKRVIAEYKRFAFLAVEAGHPVSPSEAVDQAWHLHLTYTQSYWKTFCPEVLQTPFHHNPTKGGAEESAKFDDWYTRTLESYRKFFGEPPEDIWPSPEAKAAEKNHFVRVDKETHWVIPKLRLPVRRRGLAFCGLALIFVAGCETVNPFNMRGPEFLSLFFWMCAISFGVAALMRWKLCEPSEPADTDFSNMDPYSMAFLNQGRILAVNTAIASLIERKLMRTDANLRKIYSIGSIPNDAPLLEKAIHGSAADTGETIGGVRESAKPVVTAMMEQMEKHGLLVNEAQSLKVRWTGLLIAVIPVAIGMIKILVGLMRGKPVAFLVIGCLVVVVGALFAFARRPHRSRRGDAVLDELKSRYRFYGNLQSNYSGLTPEQIAIGVGLFGMSALAGTAMADLQKTLRPPPSAGSGFGFGSGGCGSSCGGGCGGGGSSCGGGGGCGGGGCGGCGGGH